ncbi:PQQ-dependent sugar dehydrogenase [Cyclobacterium xiamenense]|uniref:PQQ-dependent sugar dehydrogenase n=1 Tax=Cyclobacterium xiamenense TaxID=1297121 RepID=UPI0012B79566|nr:PQQ-dependent sugar dehydrogenase [Cyclobacterium xiamenense]
MNNRFYGYLLFAATAISWSCSPGDQKLEELIPMDEAALANGEDLFGTHCSSCHGFEQDGIGPQLGGITREQPLEWLRRFIKNPTEVIDSGDERAGAVFARYKSYMPGFAYLEEKQIDAIIAYMHQYPAPQVAEGARGDSILNPIPEPIPLSDLVVELEWISTIPASAENKPLTRIAKMDYHPVTGDLYIMDLRGKMYRMQGEETQLYLDMQQEMPAFINQPGLATGFGSFAFHPDFGNNGLLYTSHTEKPGTAAADFAYGDSIKSTLQWVVTEWQTGQPLEVPLQANSRELFRIDMVTGIHGMQELTFNPLVQKGDPDYGLLYIGIGDGGSVGAGHPWVPHGASQAWGSIFRIDPSGSNSANGNYGIPPNNPFVGREGALPEIYAHGFRNAHRITWTADGKMLATNIGQGQIESLYIVHAGDDYGWPVREGTFVIDSEVAINQVFPLPENDAEFGYTYPVAMYDHDEGNAISGGYEYQGSQIPALQGKYLFGDIVRGRLFFVETDDLVRGRQAPIYEWQVSYEGTSKPLSELSGSNRVDLRLARDRQGEMYLFTKADGKVYRIAGTKQPNP